MPREGSFRGAECVLGGAGGFRAAKGFAWREDGFSMGEMGFDPTSGRRARGETGFDPTSSRGYRKVTKNGLKT